MNKKVFQIFGVAICLLFMSACKPEYYNRKYIDILTSHRWIVNTYVDNSQNITLDTQPIIYSFHKDGTMEKEYDTGFIATATWHLSEDNEYLRMGNNMFKLQTLTNRLLAVRYGDVDMFFVSIKE